MCLSLLCKVTYIIRFIKHHLLRASLHFSVTIQPSTPEAVPFSQEEWQVHKRHKTQGGTYYWVPTQKSCPPPSWLCASLKSFKEGSPLPDKVSHDWPVSQSEWSFPHHDQFRLVHMGKFWPVRNEGILLMGSFSIRNMRKEIGPLWHPDVIYL